MKKSFLRIADELSLVLTAFIFPSVTGLWAAGWSFGATLIRYICCIALCVLDGRRIEKVERKRVLSYALCIVLPLALKVLLEYNTPIDFAVNSILALLSILVGYKSRK